MREGGTLLPPRTLTTTTLPLFPKKNIKAPEPF